MLVSKDSCSSNDINKAINFIIITKECKLTSQETSK